MMTPSQPFAQDAAKKLKVLIADDDLPTRMLLRAAITQWNYEVVEVKDGDEAWKMLQTSPEPPGLLILDWLMPGLDGVALSERIKYKPGVKFSTFIILLTQLTGATNITRALEAGADEFLSKPFNMVELRSRLAVGAKIIANAKRLSDLMIKCEQYAEFIREIRSDVESLQEGKIELIGLANKVKKFTV